MSKAVEAPKHDLILKRVFDAPRELVFQPWTDPKHPAEYVAKA